MVHTAKLSAPVRELKGVGTQLESRLNRLGIYNVHDLLFLLPSRYMDRTRVTPIGSLQPGISTLTQGEIELTQVRFGRRRSLLCRISDGTGALVVRLFHFSRQQQAGLARGSWIRCWGTPRRSGNTIEMIHPEYQFIKQENLDDVEQSLTPVYPATEGLTQARLRRFTDQALLALERDPEDIVELLPSQFLDQFSLPDISRALNFVHRPPPDADTDSLLAGTHPAQQRLAFEELLAHHLSLQQFRKNIQSHRAPAFGSGADSIRKFVQTLGFPLTSAQDNVINEILSDISTSIPMLRLVQGDVGSGKTVVAGAAACIALASGYQAALMAPTELLAEQHYRNFSSWFSHPGFQVVLLTGRLPAAEKTARQEQLRSGVPLLVIGTHALFQEKIEFGKLGLVIIDEQHRFGVHQRMSLLEKGKSADMVPHQLIMTATPIPRTITMTVFADLDISVIDELPPGRKPVNTVVLSSERRPELVRKIETICNEGRQVYWICTLIDESDVIESTAATETYESLKTMLPGIRIGLVHGRMKGREKENVMASYKSGEMDLLVATTVIEVGVDVPAASLMIIENAERLGLSQLHQLRGRVGRGNEQSDCILLYQAPLSDMARTRLEIMRSSCDGFEIARKDLELRGPGEILGTRQSGLPEMRFADLMRDAGLMPRVQKAAALLELNFPENARQIISRWLSGRNILGSV